MKPFYIFLHIEFAFMMAISMLAWYGCHFDGLMVIAFFSFIALLLTFICGMGDWNERLQAAQPKEE